MLTKHIAGQRIMTQKDAPMLDRLILAVSMTVAGGYGLLPPEPPTTQQLRQAAKQKSVDKVCDKPRKTKKVIKLCKRWQK